MVDVQQLLGDVAEITRPRWKNLAEAANIHINLDLACASGLLVLGDESELREVLVNLVFNAVDAMPEGGRLTLAAKETSDLIEISVHDTGTGMTEETRLRVFDPFFTTKDMLGMGLGLAVSYGIICRHEGTVEVESQVGVGTTFRVRLPIGKPAAKKQLLLGMPVAVEPHFKSGQTKILVVDDEEYVRDLLRDILEQQGCEVVVAKGGREALSLFENGDFDAVFTDVGMPDMNGWELSRAVRQCNNRIPVAVITGWGEAVSSHERQAARVDWVVAKPFDAPQIAEMAREVLRRKVQGKSSGVGCGVNQPRRGWISWFCRSPGLAEKRQPWAGGLNPFGIPIPDLPRIRCGQSTMSIPLNGLDCSWLWVTGLKPGVNERGRFQTFEGKAVQTYPPDSSDFSRS
jgi:CheY-like chemotaxis protein